jgi:hypothetical protein
VEAHEAGEGGVQVEELVDGLLLQLLKRLVCVHDNFTFARR